MASKPTISIFGSTGGSGLALLRPCLAAAYQCTVLVRNPKKLLSLLGLAGAPSNLTIVTGSIRDVSAVQRALRTSDARLVDVVVSCIGFVPSLAPASKSFNPFANVDDLNLCRDGTEILVSAIAEIKSTQTPEAGRESRNPLLVVLSTTGITGAGRDIPLLMMPFYHRALKTPHQDKKAMEDFLKSSALPASQPWIAIRPSLLVGDGQGEPTGKQIRVGMERDGKHDDLQIGYTIKREDVGDWIFKEIVQGHWAQWNRTAVTLTY